MVVVVYPSIYLVYMIINCDVPLAYVLDLSMYWWIVSDFVYLSVIVI